MVAHRPGSPSASPDVTIAGTSQSLAAFIFGQPDPGPDISGGAEAVQRFRRLIPSMAAVVRAAR